MKLVNGIQEGNKGKVRRIKSDLWILIIKIFLLMLEFSLDF